MGICEMKILWLVNVVLPVISKEIGERINPRGGWLINFSQQFQNNENYDLFVLFPFTGKKPVDGIVDNLEYYGFIRKYKDPTKYDKHLEDEFIKVIKDYRPDIIHIWGTEYPHTLALVNAAKIAGLNKRVVVSIQGLVSRIAEHYLTGIPCDIRSRSTIYNIYKRKYNLKVEKNSFIKRGEFEIEALKNVKHIIGRTAWDKACCYQINPDAEYHFCNDSLRDSFYSNHWRLEDCSKYSIFMSQGQYPIKGLHFVLKAMPQILKNFPNTKLIIAGRDIIKRETFVDRLKMDSYARYILSIIKKHNLEDHVFFKGPLDETQMVKQYLSAHVFVSPSTIENSPNSVGEAMILGVPVISSNVGGVEDLLVNKSEGFLYQYDSPLMLAYYVNRIFSDNSIVKKFSQNAKEHALKTHDRAINIKTLLGIYKKISSNLS